MDARAAARRRLDRGICTAGAEHAARDAAGRGRGGAARSTARSPRGAARGAGPAPGMSCRGTQAGHRGAGDGPGQDVARGLRSRAASAGARPPAAAPVHRASSRAAPAGGADVPADAAGLRHGGACRLVRRRDQRAGGRSGVCVGGEAGAPGEPASAGERELRLRGRRRSAPRRGGVVPADPGSGRSGIPARADGDAGSLRRGGYPRAVRRLHRVPGRHRPRHRAVPVDAVPLRRGQG